MLRWVGDSGPAQTGRCRFFPQPQDALDGRRNLVVPVRHVNCRDSSGADERIHGLNEKVSVRQIKSLAGLVKDQQTGILDQRPDEENHPLQACGEGKW
jgi:hypothetical protein